MTTFEELAKKLQEELTGSTQNAYQIRLKILDLAQTQAFQPFNHYMNLYDNTAKAQWEADEIMSKIHVPTPEDVLKIAMQFNDFVSGNTPTSKK